MTLAHSRYVTDAQIVHPLISTRKIFPSVASISQTMSLKLLPRVLLMLLAFPFLAKAQYFESTSLAFGNQTAPVTGTAMIDNYYQPEHTYYLSQVWGDTSAFTMYPPSSFTCCGPVPVDVKFDPTAVPLGSYSANLYAGYSDYPGGSSFSLILGVYATGSAVAYGTIFPKFVVLSVLYAPPGQRSFVDYGSSTAMGTSNSWDSSFSSKTTISVSVTAKVPVLGSTTGKASNSWTQAEDTSSSISVNKSNNIDIIIPGPANSSLGIDHDFDQIAVWLNPVGDFTLTSSSTASWAYSFDQRDPANEVDVIYLYVKDVKDLQAGTFNGDPNILSRLARTWASPPTDGSGTGLTSADYAAILARDSFANGQTTIDSTRFDLVGGQTIPYQPPACGGQPDTFTYSQAYQTTSTNGTAATDTYEVGYSLSVDHTFTSWLQANFTYSQDLTWTNKWAHQSTQTTGQTAKLSVTGPSDCTYSGPTNVQAYQDNVYGTFMFAFVP